LTTPPRPAAAMNHAVRCLTIVTPCYNEEENVRQVYQQVKTVMQTLPGYEYEHLFIDNASKDKTVEILRELAAADKHVKVIVNTRNFGQIRSPYYAFLQASGDAVMGCAADLQDPPELMPQFVKKWEEGYKVVIGVKEGSKESWFMYRIRRFYYWLVNRLSSDVELVHNFTGFGLYDREVIEQMRSTDEQYPYFRGLVCDLGYERAEIKYMQPARTRGRTKNNFFSLYDYGMLGITNHSKVPLRVATMAGFILAALSLLSGTSWPSSFSGTGSSWAWRQYSSASTSLGPCNCSSSAYSESTSGPFTPRCTNVPWSLRRSASDLKGKTANPPAERAQRDDENRCGEPAHVRRNNDEHQSVVSSFVAVCLISWLPLGSDCSRGAQAAADSSAVARSARCGRDG
jgi:glycosyltransferase involved in cell wall biosynthesis